MGQVNGLAVIDLGELFCPPGPAHRHRVHRPGRVTDIEREVALGDPLHAKGVMILWGYLARATRAGAAGARREPGVRAVLRPVEGDSASAAELFALLSALADAPIKQVLAVTGSVNQSGEVQADRRVSTRRSRASSTCARAALPPGRRASSFLRRTGRT
ncbi:MAG: hypothetical protein M5R42_01965 [Rhodocyclaceae bacterium]|nr:hypothetical protein [Rhodocyclaceae bacterium]